MNTCDPQANIDPRLTSAMPFALMVLFLFVSYAFLYVFDGDHKERYAAFYFRTHKNAK